MTAAVVEFQVRHATASDWTSDNPILKAGELGCEQDTGKLKVGDGSTTWTSLPYLSGGAGAVAWGAITGTLSDQTDLGTALASSAQKANNLSDLGSASAARSNLGVAIGTDVLAPDGDGSELTGLDESQVSGLGDLATASTTGTSWLKGDGSGGVANVSADPTDLEWDDSGKVLTVAGNVVQSLPNGGDPLDVTIDSDEYSRFQLTNTSTGSDAGAGCLFINNDSEVLQFYQGSSGNSAVPHGVLFRSTGSGGFNIVADAGPIAFGTDQTMGAAELMRLTNDGKLGIGVIAPDETLHVVGGAKITDLAGTGDRLATADVDGVLSATTTAPSGDIVGTTDAQTLTAKRVTPRVGSQTSSSTPTINSDSYDDWSITALAAAAAFSITGTPTHGQRLLLWISDDGTARTLTQGTGIVNTDVASFPTTTIVGKVHMVLLVWDAVFKSKWLVMAAGTV